MKSKKRPDFRGGGRYRHPQAWIDLVSATDPALANVRLSYRPRYSGRLIALGCATLEDVGLPGRTTIGRASLKSRVELIDTIIHEEVHHRLWLRVRRDSARAKRIINNLDAEEDYVEEVTRRLLKCKGVG